MKIRVFFDVMRHGEKDGDALTPKGVSQVHASAQANLAGRTYVASCYSGMMRARQTVIEALTFINHGVTDYAMIEEPGFGYEWATDPRFPTPAAMDQLAAHEKAGSAPTVALCLDVFGPPMWAIRGRFLGTLEKWALYFAIDTHNQWSRIRGSSEPGPPPIFVLVGSHSPTSELACLDPSTTPRLREADGITYEMEVDTETLAVTMLSSKVWRCPEGVE